MKIPYEFEQFVGCIYPVDPRESESLQSRAAAALEVWNDDDLRPVLAFLHELLDAAIPTQNCNTSGGIAPQTRSALCRMRRQASS